MFIICVQFVLNCHWPGIRCHSEGYTDRFSEDWIQKDTWSFERSWNASSGMRVHRFDLEDVIKRYISLRTIQRRNYNVKGSNSLWHIDGIHKVIRLVAICHLVFYTEKQSERKQSQLWIVLNECDRIWV